MKLTIHSQGWSGSRARQEDEPGEVLFGSVIEIDGQLIEMCTRVRVISDNEDFTKVIVHLIPAQIEYVSHTEKTWKELLAPKWIHE